VVDLTAEEEMCSTSALQVAVDGGGAVCGLTKRRQKGVDPSLALVSGCRCCGCAHSSPSLVLTAWWLQVQQPVVQIQSNTNNGQSQTVKAHFFPVSACWRGALLGPSAGDGRGGAAGGGQAARGAG
jgi:hypothetical protein